MNILIYAKNGVGEQIRKSIENMFSDTEVYRTINDLTTRFRYPMDDPTVAVLLVQNREDLAEILSIGDLLRDVRTILILPDRDAEAIAEGHSLLPRFLSYLDSDPQEVTAVLEKMLRFFCSLPQGMMKSSTREESSMDSLDRAEQVRPLQKN